MKIIECVFEGRSYMTTATADKFSFWDSVQKSVLPFIPGSFFPTLPQAPGFSSPLPLNIGMLIKWILPTITFNNGTKYCWFQVGYPVWVLLKPLTVCWVPFRYIWNECALSPCLDSCSSSVSGYSVLSVTPIQKLESFLRVFFQYFTP